MKRARRNSCRVLMLLAMIFFVVCVVMVPLEARKHKTKECRKCHNSEHPKEKRSNSHNTPINLGTSSAPSPSPHCGYNPSNNNNVFDIFSFGAHGDGVSDDSEALLLAWKAACNVQDSIVVIPAGFKFLIMPVTLQGACMPQLVLKIDGSLVAPPQVGAWPKSCLFEWLNFKWLHNFTIQGSGTVDAQGFDWWSPSSIYSIKKRSKHVPGTRPTAMRFYASNNVTIRDISILNSPQCHLKFDNAGGIMVDNITISSPGTSPNTDGIHLQNTKDVEIQHSNIACGDDCISVQTGCSNIHVHHINCGPGHGISLGGLGKDKTVACVSDIVIEEVFLQNTLAGVRMKTWQGGLGSVKNISFSNIQVSDVQYPIIIDQYYCEDKKYCKNQTGAVAITGVKYQSIIGTYTVQPIHLACSDDVPCTDVDLIDVQLRPSPGIRGLEEGLCWKSYGKMQAPIVPNSIEYYCLRLESGSFRRALRLHEHVCR